MTAADAGDGRRRRAPRRAALARRARAGTPRWRSRAALPRPGLEAMLDWCARTGAGGHRLLGHGPGAGRRAGRAARRARLRVGLAAALDGARPRSACRSRRPTRAWRWSPTCPSTGRASAGRCWSSCAAGRTASRMRSRASTAPTPATPRCTSSAASSAAPGSTTSTSLPSQRRRGLGRALTLAVCRAAARAGARVATLNATGEGELLYRALGFRSLGLGQTWWIHRAGLRAPPPPELVARRRGGRARRPPRARAPRSAARGERLPGNGLTLAEVARDAGHRDGRPAG